MGRRPKHRRIARQHRRRAKQVLRHGPKAVRAHNRPRPNGRKVRVKHR